MVDMEESGGYIPQKRAEGIVPIDPPAATYERRETRRGEPSAWVVDPYCDPFLEQKRAMTNSGQYPRRYGFATQEKSALNSSVNQRYHHVSGNPQS